MLTHTRRLTAVDNAINGIPNCGNHQLLTGLLREEWGFDGHVVSDCAGIDHIWAEHKFVKDPAEATALVLHAGCDADCGHDYQQNVPQLISNGTIDLKLLDRAVGAATLALPFMFPLSRPLKHLSVMLHRRSSLCFAAFPHGSTPALTEDQTLVVVRSSGADQPDAARRARGPR